MKNDIRRQMIKIRTESSSTAFNAQNDQIIKHILNDQKYIDAKCVGLFYPLKNEVNLIALTNGNKQYAFPKVEPDGIHFYLLDSKTSFRKSKFGVLEPHEGLIVDQEIDYLLVPALAISKDLYRIGFGKGYYDRFLALHRPKHVYGVIYDFQEINSFTQDVFDQKLDGYFKGSK